MKYYRKFFIMVSKNILVIKDILKRITFTIKLIYCQIERKLKKIKINLYFPTYILVKYILYYYKWYIYFENNIPYLVLIKQMVNERAIRILGKKIIFILIKQWR